MTTLPPPKPGSLADAHRAAADVRRLLLDLGADPELLRGVAARQDGAGRGYVRIPPLPVAMADHLVRLLPPGAAS